MKLFTFPSNVENDVQLAYTRKYWSIWTDRWQDATITRVNTRIANLNGSMVGHIGIFYCSDGQYLTMPFVIKSIPTEDTCDEDWTEPRTGRFGFNFVPFGHPEKKVTIEELRELLGTRWNNVLGVSPTDAFTCREIPSAIAAEILERLT